MELKIMGHTSRYQVEQLQQSLFSLDAPGTAISAVHRAPNTIFFFTRITIGDKVTAGDRQLAVKDDATRTFYRCLRQSYFDAALPHLDEYPAWGALAGVRPTKISTRHLLEGGTLQSADELLRDEYYVTPERRELALACSTATLKALEKTEKQDVSVYIGIPFCPSRCSYCSFISRTAEKKGMLEDYLQALIREIEVTGQMLQKCGRSMRTLYIGGGTPTVLSEDQLSRLLSAVKTHLDFSRCLEWTVEAGRPDTLTEKKLALLHQYGVQRISINPQTMNDNVLKACGRPHSAQDICQAYEMARKAGIADINMDLIAGLPEDTVDGFCQSLDRLIEMNPENITVHTLALKKGADLFENRQQLPSREQVKQMLDYSRKVLTQAGYRPYYLYRQKYMSGNYENIGWSRDNRDCLYNIYMMEELHPIISLGGGGVSKVNLSDTKLERVANPKFPEQYLQQFDKVLEHKETLADLLGSMS